MSASSLINIKKKWYEFSAEQNDHYVTIARGTHTKWYTKKE